MTAPRRWIWILCRLWLVAVLFACAPQTEKLPAEWLDYDKAQDLPPMVRLDGGNLTMGFLNDDPLLPMDDESWPREEPWPVQIRAFLIDTTETTNAQYRRCVAAEICRPSLLAEDPRYNGAEQPVVGVAWEDARRYCEWRRKRLPTETEWEYAARYGDDAIAPTAPPAVAWLADNSQGQPHPVAGRRPNAAGLYDMLGNVWEWCDAWYMWPPKNWYRQDALRDEVPELFVAGRVRVLRGGAWNTEARDLRPTLRFWQKPERRSPAVGFRCARDYFE